MLHIENDNNRPFSFQEVRSPFFFPIFLTRNLLLQSTVIKGLEIRTNNKDVPMSSDFLVKKSTIAIHFYTDT
jgi:hypothetical protein